MNMLVLASLFLVEAAFITFSVIMVRNGLKDNLDKSFLAFLIAFAVWAALNYASNLVQLDHWLLLLLNRSLFVASSLGLLSLADFVRVVTKSKSFNGLFRLLVVLTSTVSVLATTPFVVHDIIVDNSNVSSVGISFGVLSNLYFAAVLFLAAYITAQLILGATASNKKTKSSSRTLLITTGVALLAMLITNVVLPVVFNNFDFSTIGLLFGALIISGVGYAVARHGLFDIRLAVVRSVTYSLILATLACVYLIITLIFSAVLGDYTVEPSQIFVSVIASMILVAIFQPIKRFFDKVTNRFFYKDNYNIDDFFTHLNRTLTSTTELRGLLERVAIEISKTLKSEQAFFFVNIPDGRYVSAGTPGHKSLPKDDASKLKSATASRHGVIVRSMLGTDDSVRRMMLSHRLELILPLRRADDYVGYLCLGDSLASGYKRRDIRLLRTISDELVIAIENALSVQEIRNLNATLQQRVNEATKELRTSNAQLQRLDKAKDEFVSMASHQLRTPLTSVKGYISMVLEGDTGKITDAQEHLLGEAFNSSERMVHLINDFLNVSRLQTGKFIIDKRPVDLSKVVEQELGSLATNASSRNLKFVYKSPKSFPILNIDEGKIRQVIMNFADNAIFYSGESTEIRVNLSVEAGNCVFTVKDAGIGVPKNEQAQLFSKFYRASNARKQRPDGTGVGLFLAKKVIAAHGGKIIFESSEGKGSTFGFSLPVGPLRPSDDTNQLKDKPDDNKDNKASN